MSLHIVDSLLRELDALHLRPCAFQARWEGDTRGWFVRLEAVVADEGGYYAHPLVFPRLHGDDHPVGNDPLPVQEARLAAELGEAMAARCGVPFWFPSPLDPDSGCPNWWERDLAIHCAQCGKAILPRDGENVAKDICSTCHIARLAREQLRGDAPSSPHLVSVHLIDGDDEVTTTRHSTPELSAILRVVLGDPTWAATLEADGEITLGSDALATIAARVRDEIDRRIAALPEDEEPPVARPLRRRLVVDYEGRRLDRDASPGRPGWYLRFDLEDLARVERALVGSMRVWVVSRRGITTRGRHMMEVLRRLGGPAELDSIARACGDGLERGEVEAALSTIRALGYACVDDDRWSLTRRGRHAF